MLPGPRQVGFSGRGFWGRVPSWSAACGAAGSRGCSAGLPAQGLYPAPMASTSPLGRLSVCQPLPVRPAGWQGLGLLESVVGGNAVLDGVLTGPAVPSSSEGPGPGWHSFPLMPFAVPLNVCGQGPPQARSPVGGLQAAFLRTPPPVESAPLGGVRLAVSGCLPRGWAPGGWQRGWPWGRGRRVLSSAAAARNPWTGSSRPWAAGAHPGSAPPASASRSRRCCAPASAPSTQPAGRPGTTSTAHSPRRPLPLVSKAGPAPSARARCR